MLVLDPAKLTGELTDDLRCSSPDFGKCRAFPERSAQERAQRSDTWKYTPIGAQQGSIRVRIQAKAKFIDANESAFEQVAKQPMWRRLG